MGGLGGAGRPQWCVAATPEARCWGRLPHRGVWNLPCILGLAQAVATHRQQEGSCCWKWDFCSSFRSLLSTIVSEGFCCLFLYLRLSQNSIPLLPLRSQLVQMGLTPTLPQGLALLGQSEHCIPLAAVIREGMVM